MTHQLETLSLGEYPACNCTCLRWGFICTLKRGETEADARQMLSAAFLDHLAEIRLSREELDRRDDQRRFADLIV